mgnify:CR=1 FL=1
MGVFLTSMLWLGLSAVAADGAPVAGKVDEATEVVGEAIDLYESKGNVLQAGTARAKLDALTG